MIMKTMALETDKKLCGIGSILIAIGFLVPFLGLIGIILLLIGLKGLSNDYNSPVIFQNALYGFIFGIVSIIILSIAMITIFLVRMSTIISMNGMIMGPFRMFGIELILALLLLIITFVLFLLSAIFYKRSFDIIAEKSGEKLFNTIGILLIIGSVLIILLVGYIILIAAWIIAAIAFFSIRSSVS
ncbi:MAG: hypothetical protein DSO09_01625 [Candidatus Methanomethylicota archaeon]|uniref:DUF996 domain-containing protein n=1 Tax=Thermoproteota archaeon TaxID=2056631 RepID=A0A523BFY9_9CREN|nr:MAG: DUF996 domain-containing protein [Candidatus Verstraetearchaeota archaeon]TDA39825.1 MAG: hypothetical protein DSO09_01625 [Candidatus Verstraetearchaeota archaeon]